MARKMGMLILLRFRTRHARITPNSPQCAAAAHPDNLCEHDDVDDDNANDQSNLPKTEKRKDRGESGDDGAHKKQRGENEPAGEDQPEAAQPAHPEPATEPTNPLTPLNLPEDSDAEENIDVGGNDD